MHKLEFASLSKTVTKYHLIDNRKMKYKWKTSVFCVKMYICYTNKTCSKQIFQFMTSTCNQNRFNCNATLQFIDHGFLDHAKLPCFSFKLLPQMISPGMATYLATCLTTFQREDFQVSNCTQIPMLCGAIAPAGHSSHKNKTLSEKCVHSD